MSDTNAAGRSCREKGGTKFTRSAALDPLISDISAASLSGISDRNMTSRRKTLSEKTLTLSLPTTHPVF